MARPLLRSGPASAPALVPGVWRGEDLACGPALVVPSGHGLLDQQLPGGGWPRGSLIELLQARPEQPLWQLLLPALVQMLQQQAGPLLLVQPPCVPFGPGLRAQGLPFERVLWVRAETSKAGLWACEQALRAAEVAAVLAWLPQADAAALRRLQLAAQPQQRLLFVLRGHDRRHEASPAPLRLLLEDRGEACTVQILKRRGPPLAAPLVLPARAPRLGALLGARRRARPLSEGPAGPVRRGSAMARQPHALDRSLAH